MRYFWLLELLVVFLAISCGKSVRTKNDTIGSLLDSVGNIPAKDVDAVNTLAFYDSLSRIAGNDTLLSRILSGKGKLFEKTGLPDSAITTYNQLLTIATRNADTTWLWDAYNSLADLYIGKGRYGLARASALNAMQLAVADSVDYMTALSSLASVTLDQGKPADAIISYRKVFEYFRRHNDTLNMAIQLLNMANAFGDAERHGSAIAYSRRAADLFKQVRNDAFTASSYNTLAVNYKDIGNDSALLYYEQSRDIYTALNDSMGIVMVLYNKAMYLSEHKQYDEAKSILDNVLAYCRRKGVNYGEVITINGLARVYSETGRLDRALVLMDSAIHLANDVSIEGVMPVFAKNKAEYMARYGMFKKAYYQLLSYVDQRDSIRHDKNIALAVELQQLYEASEWKNANRQLLNIAELRRQQLLTRNRYLIVLSFLSIVLGILTFTAFHFFQSRDKAYRALVMQNDDDLLPLAPVLPHNRKHSGDGQNEAVTDPEWIGKIYELIDNKIYLNSSLTVDQFTKEAGINRREFSTWLQERRKQNFNQFINFYRVKYAIKLLTEEASSNFKVDYIASLSGFNSRQSFYQVFSQVMGMPPGNYKKTYRENRYKSAVQKSAECD